MNESEVIHLLGQNEELKIIFILQIEASLSYLAFKTEVFKAFLND